MAAGCQEAFGAVLPALRPGALAREVYAAWQAVVDRAGLGHYRRHHCGYAVGIGMPPSWTGGNSVTGLRSDGDLALRSGKIGRGSCRGRVGQYVLISVGAGSLKKNINTTI